MKRASELRRAFAGFLPFVLYRKEWIWVTVMNGKKVRAEAAIDEKGAGIFRSIRVCTQQCCVYHLVRNTLHEGLHVLDVLESEIKGDPEFLDRQMGGNSPGREASFALLSSILKIPPYCATIGKKGG